MFSKWLFAPRMSLPGRGSGLIDLPRSTRKFWIEGFESGSTIDRLNASAAISRYASICSGEKSSVSALFTNPSLETASGGSVSVTSSSSSSSSRRVLRYCGTVRRRALPFFGVGRERAASSASVIQSSAACRSGPSGCGAPSGGMTLSPICLRITSHKRRRRSSNDPSSWSSRTPEIAVSVLWHR